MTRRIRREYVLRVIVDDHDEVTAIVETPSFRAGRFDLSETTALQWGRDVLRGALRGLVH